MNVLEVINEFVIRVIEVLAADKCNTYKKGDRKELICKDHDVKKQNETSIIGKCGSSVLFIKN